MDHVLDTTPTGKKMLLVTGVGDSAKAEEEALRAAVATGAEIVLLQILTSDLYHYGHNDLIATRPSKAQFLLYVREQVLERAGAEAEELRRKAQTIDVSLHVRPVETEDAVSAVIAEATKGYDAIFIAKEKKTFLPFFKKKLASQLRRRLPGRVIEC